jgi:hypothetical protein
MVGPSERTPGRAPSAKRRTSGKAAFSASSAAGDRAAVADGVAEIAGTLAQQRLGDDRGELVRRRLVVQ